MFWSSVSKSLLAVCVVTEFAVIFVESFTCEDSHEIPELSNTCSTNCFSQTQEIKMPEPSTNQTYQKKGCFEGQCTNLTFSATLGDQWTFRYDQQCCNSDNCNQMVTQPTQAPAEVNGVQCLACYSDTNTLCIPTLLKCTGDETKCVLFIGTVAESNDHPSVTMVGAGCATESACNLNMTVFEDKNIRTFCSSGIPVPPPPPTTSSAPARVGLPPTSTSTVPVLISLLLLKVLF